MHRWTDPELRTIKTSGDESINGVSVQLHTKVQIHDRATRSSSHLVTFAFKKGRSLLFSWAPTWSQVYRLLELLAEVDPHFNEKMEPVHDLIHTKLTAEYNNRELCTSCMKYAPPGLEWCQTPQCDTDLRDSNNRIRLSQWLKS